MNTIYALMIVICSYMPNQMIPACEQEGFQVVTYQTTCDTIHQEFATSCGLDYTLNQLDSLKGKLTPYGCGFRMVTEVRIDTIQQP